MAKYNISIDKDECIGCGTCVALCDDNYEMTGEGKAKVKKAVVDELGCNEDAEESCPVKCIHIKEV